MNGSHGMLLLSIQVQGYLVQTEMLEIKRVARQVSVERSVAHQSDDYARGKLSGKQFIVTHVQVILRNCKRLAHHSCSSTFQCLGMGQKHGRHQLHFSHK